MTAFEFDIYPHVGAIPIRFGMPRGRLAELLGIAPRPSRHGDWFGGVRVRYDAADCVAEIEFEPTGVRLMLLGQPLWDGISVEDPVPCLLHHDPELVEFAGVLISLRLGVACTGFHAGDPTHRSLSIFQQGTWDRNLPKAVRPDLGHYTQKRRPNKPLQGTEGNAPSSSTAPEALRP